MYSRPVAASSVEERPELNHGSALLAPGDVSMTATFHLSSTPHDARLRVDGELDVQSRGPLAWRLLDLEQLECTTYELDLGNVTHVDSGCLRLIDDARERIVARGAEFHVFSASFCFRLLTRVGGYAALAEEAERPRVPPPAGGRTVRMVPDHDGIPKPAG
jgi:ABC-type transporter Mla MlaB component